MPDRQLKLHYLDRKEIRLYRSHLYEDDAQP